MADISTYLFADDGAIPNHPDWPMIVYKGAFADESGDRAVAIENAFHTNGWGNSWRNGIYPFPHFHSNAHEVLGIAAGSATVRFGGELGGVFEVEPGDVVLLPAGTGHQNLGASGDLLVIGAYPSDCADWDLCRGDADHDRAVASITKVPRPSTDPVTGTTGGIHDHWQ